MASGGSGGGKGFRQPKKDAKKRDRPTTKDILMDPTATPHMKEQVFYDNFKDIMALRQNVWATLGIKAKNTYTPPPPTKPEVGAHGEGLAKPESEYVGRIRRKVHSEHLIQEQKMEEKRQQHLQQLKERQQQQQQQQQQKPHKNKKKRSKQQPQQLNHQHQQQQPQKQHQHQQLQMPTEHQHQQLQIPKQDQHQQLQMLKEHQHQQLQIPKQDQHQQQPQKHHQHQQLQQAQHHQHRQVQQPKYQHQEHQLKQLQQPKQEQQLKQHQQPQQLKQQNQLHRQQQNGTQLHVEKVSLSHSCQMNPQHPQLQENACQKLQEENKPLQKQPSRPLAEIDNVVAAVKTDARPTAAVCKTTTQAHMPLKRPADSPSSSDSSSSSSSSDDSSSSSDSSDVDVGDSEP